MNNPHIFFLQLGQFDPNINYVSILSDNKPTLKLVYTCATRVDDKVVRRTIPFTCARRKLTHVRPFRYFFSYVHVHIRVRAEFSAIALCACVTCINETFAPLRSARLHKRICPDLCALKMCLYLNWDDDGSDVGCQLSLVLNSVCWVGKFIGVEVFSMCLVCWEILDFFVLKVMWCRILLLNGMCGSISIVGFV